ncbi:MAG: beta-CASP ribonuclease aCPSF1, partial [Candidatus Methanomethylophilaceae archaeon]|nr:beta-CASP ribonuclease aCPSF1 [Candidatus Methanomethylophilaceae archaeon]
MNVDRLFESITQDVHRLVPKDLNITSITFEGPLVVIYTNDYEKASANTALPKMLAQNIHRRVDIRPDPTTLE